MLAALGLLGAGCWTGAPVAPTVTAATHEDPRQPRTRIDLAAAISGPIVVLDVNASTVRTLCGNDALAAVREWQASFDDASRPGPSCTRSGNQGEKLTCFQIDHDGMRLELDLLNPHTPHLVDAIVEQTCSSRSRARRVFLMNRLIQQVDSATCP